MNGILLRNLVNNVKFPPINIIINIHFSHLGFKVRPVNSGYQCTHPVMIANTAPIDST